MRIKSVTVNNFKCLGPDEIKINWDDIIILVGENNVGKSSFLEATYRYFDNDKSLPAKYFRDIEKIAEGETIGPIEIMVHFTGLTDADKEQTGVRNRLTDDGDWILKKVFDYNGGEKSDPVKYLTFTKSKTVTGINEDSTWSQVNTRFANLGISREKNSRGKVSSEIGNLIDELVQKYPGDVQIGETAEWIPNPGGFQSNIDSFLQNKAQYVFIHAIHDVRQESEGEKSSFGQLFNLLVKEEVQSSSAMDNFRATLREIAQLYKKDDRGSRGLSVISDIERGLSEKVSRIISASALVGTRELDEEKISQTVLPLPKIEIDDGYPTAAEDQGSGLQRCLILALLQTLAEQRTRNVVEDGPRNILFIEEPELYMHPQMERKMRDTLYAIARQDGFQVICTTHSPIFLDMADNHKSIVIFEKDETRKVKPVQVEEEIFIGTTQDEQKKRLRMVLNFDPAVNEVFFARRIVLVEGDSEIAALTRGAELLNIPSGRIRDTALINCRGKRTIPAFMRVLNHFKKRYFVLHDKDGDDDFNQIIADLASENGLGQVKFVDNTLEDVLEIGEPSKKDKPIQALKRIDELHRLNNLQQIFGDYINFAFGP